MKKLLIIILLLAGCANQPTPSYYVFKDYFGKCHAVVDGYVVFDVGCDMYYKK